MIDQATLPDTINMTLGGQPVADYVWQPRLPATVSPRPFLHPVRTLAGTVVTESMPADHTHHLGVSLAVADVSGVNFWGGRTFVPGRGSVYLPNHGIQRHQQWYTCTDSTAHHEVRWSGPDGTDLLHERRRLAAVPLHDDAWVLDFDFELTNISGKPLSFASPATNGRPGAGYGGFFWRARRGDRRVQVLGPDHTGERNLHGQRTPWLALVGGDTRSWTLVFVGGGPAQPTDPWFVRSRDYAGVGSCLAFSGLLLVAPGGHVRRRVSTVVADGRLRSREVADIVGVVTAVGWDADRQR